MYKPPQLIKRYKCTVLEPSKPKKEEQLPQEIQEEIEYISIGKPKKNSKYLPGERLLRKLYEEQKKQLEIEERTNNIINNSVNSIIAALH
jgi:hypothetical protein